MLIDEYALRADTLTDFLRRAEHHLRTHPELHSAHLGVYQMYCDEAADATHQVIAVSRGWQHGEGDPPAGYPPPIAMNWDENEDAVYAFGALCAEENQDGDEGPMTSPLISLHRCADGALRPAWLGGLLRAWLDFPGAQADRDTYDDAEFVEPPEPVEVPAGELYAAALVDRAARDVLADRWIADDDPRGHFAIAQRAGDRAAAAALIRTHGRSWLGPLAKVVPLAGACFTHGALVEDVIVYGEDYGDDPAWGSVRSIEFAPESKVRITPAMKSLKRVGPIAAAQLPMLAGHAIEHLDVIGLGPLPTTLRTLAVRTQEPVFIPAMPSLQAVQLWMPEGARPSDAAALLNRSRAPAPISVGILNGARRTGLLFDGTSLRVVQPDGRDLQRWSWLAPLPTAWEPDPTLPDWLAFGLGVC